MRVNPFVDTFKFLTQGGWMTVVFWLLIVASLFVAALNLRRDPKQRSVVHVWNWLARFIVGAMWWQQSLWKLPPTYTDQADGSGGLRFWMGEMVKNAAFPMQSDLVKNIILPHFKLFAPQVYCGECQTCRFAIGRQQGFSRAMAGLPPRTGGCGISTVRVTPRATTQPCVYWPGK